MDWTTARVRGLRVNGTFCWISDESSQDSGPGPAVNHVSQPDVGNDGGQVRCQRALGCVNDANAQDRDNAGTSPTPTLHGIQRQQAPVRLEFQLLDEGQIVRGVR